MTHGLPDSPESGETQASSVVSQPMQVPGPDVQTAEPAGRAEPMFSMRGVNKHFGHSHVLKDIDLEDDPDVDRDQVVVVVGQPGSGKSTPRLGFARRAANRVVFMADGTIVEHTEPLNFFNNPRSERAKDFLGKILNH